MLRKKIKFDKKNIVLSIYVIVLCLLGPLIVVVNNSSSGKLLGGKLKITLGDKSDSNQAESLSNRISSGDRILITADSNASKQVAIRAYQVEDYQTVLKQLQTSLKSNSNDPEALIYWNNSLAKLHGNPLKLATSVPIGGNLDVAKEILRGVAQAQTQINRSGGINGRLIEMVIANDDNDPEVAKQIATELIKDKQILAVIGHNDSNVSVAAAPIYQQKKLVMITPTSSAEDLPDMGSYIFRTTPSTRALAESLADYVIDVERKKDIALCVDSQSEVSTSFQKEFTWGIYNRGGNISSTKCDFAAADFNASQIPSRMISDGADALLLAPSVRNVNQAIEIARANQGRLTLLGNHSLNTYKTLQEGQKAVNSMVLSVAWYPKPNANNDFTNNAQKLWKGSVNWRTAMAYDATEAVITALKSGDTREGVQKGLANPQFKAQGSTESIKFLPSGDRNMQGTLVKVEPGKRSGTGYDFVLLEPQLSQLSQ